MAKNSIRDYSATNSANTDIQSIDISEGCSPAGINNAIREVMADLKDVSTGAVALESPAMDSLTVDTTGIVYSGGNVGIGISNPNANLQISSASGSACTLNMSQTAVTNYKWEIPASTDAFTLVYGASTERLRIDSSGNVGIGVVPESWGSAFPSVLQVGASSSLTTSGGDNARLFGNVWYDGTNYKRITSGFAHQYEQTGGTHRWSYAANGAADSTISFSEAMRIDSSGQLIVGHTGAGSPYFNEGIVLNPGGDSVFHRDGNSVVDFSRETSDGNIVRFVKDNSVVGSIGSNPNGAGGSLTFNCAASTGGTAAFQLGGTAYLQFDASRLYPSTDNYYDLGVVSHRFDDVYATNGTIQTSDANEKQQIAALTDAEMTAAKAISALFKTFKWNDAVAEKGDAARTHAGVIAQDVQAAMTAAGLDAGDYAFFISTTWWETQTEVPAVEAVEAVLDEDGNVVTEAVEAVAAYTRTDTYETAEEAPEGATERTRMGIRYPELLAFIGAATEQRLSNIETRLAALEAN